MFHPFRCRITRCATVAQIKHEAGIMCGETAELGGGHMMVAKKSFDLADQHRQLLARELNKCVGDESTYPQVPGDFLLV
jgi:hypothetical protein